jgi:hypothetical protein
LSDCRSFGTGLTAITAIVRQLDRIFVPDCVIPGWHRVFKTSRKLRPVNPRVGDVCVSDRKRGTMKSITRSTLLFALILMLTSTYGAAQAKKVRTWNIPADILASQNQLSFNQGAEGAWYFMEAFSTVHDPRTYRLLHYYTAPCNNWEPVVGAGCWESTNLTFGNQHAPFVTANFTDHPVGCTNSVLRRIPALFDTPLAEVSCSSRVD